MESLYKIVFNQYFELEIDLIIKDFFNEKYKELINSYLDINIELLKKEYLEKNKNDFDQYILNNNDWEIKFKLLEEHFFKEKQSEFENFIQEKKKLLENYSNNDKIINQFIQDKIKLFKEQFILEKNDEINEYTFQNKIEIIKFHFYKEKQNIFDQFVKDKLEYINKYFYDNGYKNIINQYIAEKFILLKQKYHNDEHIIIVNHFLEDKLEITKKQFEKDEYNILINQYYENKIKEIKKALFYFKKDNRDNKYNKVCEIIINNNGRAIDLYNDKKKFSISELYSIYFRYENDFDILKKCIKYNSRFANIIFNNENKYISKIIEYITNKFDKIFRYKPNIFIAKVNHYNSIIYHLINNNFTIDQINKLTKYNYTPLQWFNLMQDSKINKIELFFEKNIDIELFKNNSINVKQFIDDINMTYYKKNFIDFLNVCLKYDDILLDDTIIENNNDNEYDSEYESENDSDN